MDTTLGTNLSGANSSPLVLSNVQGENAGLYTLTLSNSAGSITSRPAVLRVEVPTRSVLFAEDFTSNPATNWSVFWGAANGIPDYSFDWNYDHVADTFRFSGARSTIPPAPSTSDGSTRALRLSVNGNDAMGASAACNAYPRWQNFTDNFALRFEMWMNYPGLAGGINSTGSTQHAIFGLNHAGSRANWAAPSATASDGIWFAVDGEGGTSRDYQAYVGNPNGAPRELVGQFLSGLAESNNTALVYQNLFPASAFETAGAPGKNWVEVELRYTNNFVQWLLNGTLVAQRTNSSAFRSGNIMLGLMDTFPSIANPASETFVLFDNVRVENLDGRIQILNISRDAAHRVRVTCSAVPGESYTLESSEDLANWAEAGIMTASGKPLIFSIVEPGTRGFSRIRTQ